MILILVEYLFLRKNMYYIRYDDDCDESVYYKILTDLDRVKSDRNDIVNLINNDGHSMT